MDESSLQNNTVKYECEYLVLFQGRDLLHHSSMWVRTQPLLLITPRVSLTRISGQAKLFTCFRYRKNRCGLGKFTKMGLEGYTYWCLRCVLCTILLRSHLPLQFCAQLISTNSLQTIFLCDKRIQRFSVRFIRHTNVVVYIYSREFLFVNACSLFVCVVSLCTQTSFSISIQCSIELARTNNVYSSPSCLVFVDLDHTADVQ